MLIYIACPLSQVTVAGFEPLLKFAYTSKLLLGKNDVLEIRNSASFLGFRDLDESCFDFLLPKFFSSNDSAPVPRKTCCKKICKRQLLKEDIDSDSVLLNEKEVEPVDDSLCTQEVAWHCNKSVNNTMGSLNKASTLPPEAEGTNIEYTQCPKYRKFQLACCKESCVTDKSLNNPATVTRDNWDVSCSPPPSSAKSKKEADVEFPHISTSNSTTQSEGGAHEPWKNYKNTENVGEVDVIEKDTHERQSKWIMKEREMNVGEEISSSDRSTVKEVSSGSSTSLGERSSGFILNHCPLKTFVEAPAITLSQGFVVDITEGKKTNNSGAPPPVSITHKAEEQVEAEVKMADGEIDLGWQDRGSMESVTLSVDNARERSTEEREMAEHLARRLGSDVEPDAGSSSDTGSGQAQSKSLEWSRCHNISSTSTSCPFFQDLEQGRCGWKGAELSECEGGSQSGVSSFNSGEDGEWETETEGDSEAYARERARQVSG